jgi:hypothetical protein
MSIADSKPRLARKAPSASRKRTVAAARRPAFARYDEDFARWAFEQAALLREGASAGIDVENIAEELETLGRGEFSALRSALAVIVMHMLKWDHQPERRSRSWAISIRVQRGHAEEQISENPSLKSRLGEALTGAYKTARLTAANETGLPVRTFPPDCPYGWTDVTDRPFIIDPDDA